MCPKFGVARLYLSSHLAPAREATVVTDPVGLIFVKTASVKDFVPNQLILRTAVFVWVIGATPAQLISASIFLGRDRTHSDIDSGSDRSRNT